MPQVLVAALVTPPLVPVPKTHGFGPAVYPEPGSNSFPFRMRRAVALLAAALLLAGIAGCGGSGAEPGAPKGATLVLDFVPNAVHSGIYAAQREGYYE